MYREDWDQTITFSIRCRASTCKVIVNILENLPRYGFKIAMEQHQHHLVI